MSFFLGLPNFGAMGFGYLEACRWESNEAFKLTWEFALRFAERFQGFQLKMIAWFGTVDAFTVFQLRLMKPNNQ